jgi:cytochrome c oxidase cbb3-type subunit 3
MSGWGKMFWHSFWGRGRFAVMAIFLGSVLGIAAVLVARGYLQRAELLEIDPALIPAHPALMAFATPRGSRIFAQNCASCHGLDGRGNPAIGAANLADGEWLYGSGAINEIQQTVAYGIRSHDPRGRDLADMPAYARPIPYSREKLLPLTPTDIRDLVEFLAQAHGQPASDASVQRGRQIFDGRGGCWDCHGGDGRGDNEIGAPNLMDGVWLYGDGSRPSIFQSIADGHQGICPAWSNRLTAAQVLEVSLYVWSLSHRGGQPS